MPTLAQVRDYVDPKLANFWTNQIVPRQDAYFSARSRYWQGIITTNVDVLPDNPDNAASGKE